MNDPIKYMLTAAGIAIVSATAGGILVGSMMRSQGTGARGQTAGASGQFTGDSRQKAVDRGQ